MINGIMNTINATKFHGILDDELRFSGTRIVEKKEHRYFIVQEREVTYRFYLHQHPFVQPLVRRLLRGSTAGLQAGDTEYAPGESLPASVEVAVKADAPLTVPARSRIILDADVTAATDDGPVELARGMEFRIVADSNAKTTEAFRATLVEGMAATPRVKAEFPLDANKAAFTNGNNRITLTAVMRVTLHDASAKEARLPSGATVLLADETELTLPAGASVTLVKFRRRPVKDLYADFFEVTYAPNAELLQRPYPVKDLDFTSSGAYAVYNWELFFHVPLTIAMHLSKNQRFAEAQRWFHFLFDPTDDSDGPTPERFWKVRPFQSTDVRKIEEILVNLATGADEQLRKETINSIELWKDNPFRPHVIARFRQQAYMYQTVMAYLDNLIAWGDSLFRQDTGEAIDEAMMLYVLAANILGPRPLPVPKKGAVRPQTYANLRQDLKAFGSVMRDMEPDLPFDLMPLPSATSSDTDRLANLRSLGKALYFCVPRNDKLLTYWDTVADRLFKIRNSLNFQGVFRQLALFEPPIDPALLARAAAAGLDVSAIVNGLNQPLPLVRFQLLVQKAAEIAQEVKSLGANLLAAMEKEDGEAMAILRAKHERIVMELVEHVKYGQLQEAVKSREGLLQSLALAVQRYTYYEQQLGRKQEEIEKYIPELVELDQASLEKMKFAMKEQEIPIPDIEMDLAQDLSGEGGGKKLNTQELEEMDKLEQSRGKQVKAGELERTGAGLGIIPDFAINLEPIGVGTSTSLGGTILSKVFSFSASFSRADAEKYTYEASRAAKIGGYSRRERDWAFQSNLAGGEINQVFKQIRAAQIREAVAELELKNHRQQMKHAEEIGHFLNEEGTEKKGKKTNKALYAWMKREVKGLYSQCFQFAFDVARKAERALQHELGNRDLSYLEFGYLSGKEGLLAGEKLHLDIKRMELAYHELNQREYELTKHISLMQVDPLVLIRLRETGRCTVRVPEEVFDMDGPGHYFRRIKTVALSIPCVTGPYAGVNCTLTLLKSSIRTTQTLLDGEYARGDSEDSRFSDYFGSVQSIVTSSAQNDSGLFETNLRDERRLPFEYSGAISEWQLELPANPARNEPAQFDYRTISDVILHIRYTAREGGGLLRRGATTNLQTLIDGAQSVGSVRLFSLRHDFPTEWARFQAQKPGAGKRSELSLTLRDEHYPFWSRARLDTVARVDVLARSAKPQVPPSLEIFDQIDDQPAPAKKDTLAKDAALGNLLVGKFTNIGLPAKPTGVFRLYFEDKSLEDLWISVTFGK